MRRPTFVQANSGPEAGNIRLVVQQVLKVCAPLRIKPVITGEGEHLIDGVYDGTDLARINTLPLRRGGQGGGNGKPLIPEPGMMGTDVPYVTE